MSDRTLATLPDDTPVYVDGHGSATLGDIRRTPEEGPGLSLEEATIEMWEDIATRNLCLHPWEEPVSVSAIRAFHASRYTDAQARRRST